MRTRVNPIARVLSSQLDNGDQPGGHLQWPHCRVDIRLLQLVVEHRILEPDQVGAAGSRYNLLVARLLSAQLAEKALKLEAAERR